MQWPGEIKIREVGPRDGLQNEKILIPSSVKIELIQALAQAGVRSIEATSLVNPKAVPQLSDAEEVLSGLGDILQNVTISALVANARGIHRALKINLPEVVVVVSASQAHNRANVGMSVEQSLQVLREISGLVVGSHTRVRGAVATAFGCPVQGEINSRQVGVVVGGMLEAGIKEITLADTAGLANPRQVYTLVRQLSAQYPKVNWALHFHDTRGLALANIITGIQAGVTTLESSVGGLGGCPFLPGAAGNVATEDVILMLHSMGIKTSVDPSALIRCTRLLEKTLGRILPAKTSQPAGDFVTCY